MSEHGNQEKLQFFLMMWIKSKQFTEVFKCLWKCLTVNENFMKNVFSFSLNYVAWFQETDKAKLAVCSVVTGPKISFLCKGLSDNVLLKPSDDLTHRSKLKKIHLVLPCSYFFKHCTRGKGFFQTKQHSKLKRTTETIEAAQTLDVA